VNPTKLVMILLNNNPDMEKQAGEIFSASGINDPQVGFSEL